MVNKVTASVMASGLVQKEALKMTSLIVGSLPYPAFLSSLARFPFLCAILGLFASR